MTRRNKIVLLRAGDLKPHPTAQRHKLSQANLARIRSGYNPAALGTLHTCYLDDQHWIVDGRHRWQATLDRGEMYRRLSCEWHEEVITHADASRLFLQLNDRATMDGFSLWFNEVLAEDPVACGALAIVEKHGFQVSNGKRDGVVSCPTTLKRVYAYDLGETLDHTFGLLKSSYGMLAQGVDYKLIEGLALALRKATIVLDDTSLVRRLSGYPGGAAGLIGNAKGYAAMKRLPLPRAVAELILDAYNTGRRNGNRAELRR